MEGGTLLLKATGVGLLGLGLWAGWCGAARAEEKTYALVIENHAFSPERLEIPSGKKVKIVIENKDAAAEEFESYALNREKVIAGHGHGFVFIGPLEPGRYAFVGEFHKETAKGEIIAAADRD